MFSTEVKHCIKSWQVTTVKTCVYTLVQSAPNNTSLFPNNRWIWLGKLHSIAISGYMCSALVFRPQLHGDNGVDVRDDFREFKLQLAILPANDTFCVLFLLLDIQCITMVDDNSQALAKLHYYDGISGPKPNWGLHFKIFRIQSVFVQYLALWV